MAKVISGFKCSNTKKLYFVGDEYEGDRLEELQDLGYVEADEVAVGKTDNKSVEWPKHIGFGKYELSNGDTVKGKDAAIAAQAALDSTVNTPDNINSAESTQNEIDSSDATQKEINAPGN